MGKVNGSMLRLAAAGLLMVSAMAQAAPQSVPLSGPAAALRHGNAPAAPAGVVVIEGGPGPVIGGTGLNLGWHMHPGMHGPAAAAMAGPMEQWVAPGWRIQALMDRLKLDVTQKSAFDLMIARTDASDRWLMQEMQRINAAMRAPGLSLPNLLALQHAGMEARVAAMTAHDEALVAFYNQLTPAQRLLMDAAPAARPAAPAGPGASRMNPALSAGPAAAQE